MPRYITNVALSIKGDRIEKGTELELTAEDVAHLDPVDVTAVDGASAPAVEEPAPDVPLEEMSQALLKERAKELGLSAAGSKADLQERIMLHLTGPAPEAEENEITSE